MNQERLSNSVEIDDDQIPTPAPQKAEAPPQPRQAPKEDREPGTEFVEIKDDALKARFNHLYRTTKEAQERAARTERGMQALLDQNKKLFTAVQNLTAKQADKEAQAELSSLRSEAEQALAAGDTKTFTQVNERLTEIKAEQIAAQKAEIQPEAPVATAPPVTDTEITALNRWQQAKDPETGDYLRPWALPGHEEFESAQDMVRRVSTSEQFRDATVREILAEVDRRMARVLGIEQREDAEPNPVRRAFSAPQGRPSAPRAQSQTSLSAEERKVAENMFLGGRGAPAKNAKEAHDLYLSQKRALSRVVAVED